jgi:SnoaL-like domain
VAARRSRRVGDATTQRLRDYFAALDAGDVDAAVASFAADAVYIRPTKVGTITIGEEKARRLVVSRGRAAIRQFIEEQDAAARARGASIRHRILSVVVAGRECFVQGIVPAPEGGLDVVFFAAATLGADGLISRYAAVANESPVESTEELAHGSPGAH